MPCVDPPETAGKKDTDRDATINEDRSDVASATGPQRDVVDAPRLGTSTAKSTKGSVTSASAWSTAGYATSQIVRLGNNMVLSYLLVPEAFGTMAIVNIVILGLGMFSEVGVGPCIIQNERGDDPEFLNTAWVIQIFRGFAIALCAAILAWPIAIFYEHPALRWLIPAAAVTSIFNGFCSTAVFSLQRHLEMKAFAFFEVASQLVGSVSMCLFACLYPSVWSLVFGSLAMSATKAVISHRLIAGYQNRFRWNRDDAREMYRFGKWIFISTLLAFGAMQIDRMMLGKLFDIRVLGIYSFAFAVATMPKLMIEKLSTSILYPVLARARREPSGSIELELQRSRRVIISIGAACVVSVFAWCVLFFDTFYHEDYREAGEICQWLMAVTWISILSMTLSRALIALGNTRSLAAFNAIRLSMTILASLIGNRVAGMPGFVAGLAVGAFAGHVAITVALMSHGIDSYRQDVRYSLVLAASVGLCWLVQQPQWIPANLSLVLLTTITGAYWFWVFKKVSAYFSSEKETVRRRNPIGFAVSS